tara:strand:+ start:1597 stop:2775 length:1179 start_codon:yes stop_codon:yes gene_type:complete
MKVGADKSKTGNSIVENRESLRRLREILFANVVIAGEIPSPTGAEQRLTRFLSDRYTECGLNDISQDQAGNVAAVIAGSSPKRNLLVTAHVDKVWTDADDHTISVGVGEMSGRGIADNGLGVAVLATLPSIIQELGVKFESNLILLGTTRSFGRGDLGGMRFFLDHTDRDIDSALCVEGMNLGRLSYSSLGMARGVISAETSGEASNFEEATSGVIAALNRLVAEMLKINQQEYPAIKLLIGSIEAGSGYNVPPGVGKVRFEIRGEDAGKVAKIEKAVLGLVSQAQVGDTTSLKVEMIAHREPGDLGEKHPLVCQARGALEELGIEPRVEPSISELSALLDKRIPALTLGITKGANRHTPKEMIYLDPIFDGLAQLVSVLQFMDSGRFAFDG